jgi:hypothetical protein
MILRKLAKGRIWNRILLERLSEPLHLNLISLFVAAFGSVRAKVFFDLYVRQQHAFGLLQAADQAKNYGYDHVTAIEFGVANGAGLLNICTLARRITRATGIAFNIVGFDSGSGMPVIRDYRDHPEAYQPGWYQMHAPERLRQALPPNASLVLGNISDTIPTFLAELSPDRPIGFVSIDVDYYWSTLESLKVFTASPDCYLPLVTMYFDDVDYPTHNPWCGELGAISDFNSASEFRKIAPFNFLREQRLFKNAHWISKMFALHVLDHPARFMALKNYPHVDLEDPLSRALAS